MKKLIQNRLYRGQDPELRGNCFPTVIACLLDLDSPEEVLQIQEHYDNPRWHIMLWEWLEQRGYDWQPIDGHLYDGSFYLVCGVSPRDPNINHICIYQNGKLYHDPHPDQTGILSEYAFEIITPIQKKA